MSATTSLGLTALAYPVGKSDSQITVASTTGITAGMRLFIDRELMSVVGPGPAGTKVFDVRRGVDGTTASRHDAASPMFIGAGEHFYTVDPQGMPPNAALVNPYVNIRTGDVLGDPGRHRSVCDDASLVAEAGRGLSEWVLLATALVCRSDESRRNECPRFSIPLPLRI